MTGETYMAFRCHCGRHMLTPTANWLSYPYDLHTQDKCGPYRALRVQWTAPGTPPRFVVVWPKEEEAVR